SRPLCPYTTLFRSFLVAELKPGAQLDRGRDVLLLQQSREGRESGIGNGESERQEQPQQPESGGGSGEGSDTPAETGAVTDPANRSSQSRIPNPESRPAPQEPRQ